MQPYAPVGLPFVAPPEVVGLSAIKPIDISGTEKGAEARIDSGLLMVQLPRALSIESVETMKDEGTKTEEWESGALKAIKGKVGKLRVYKSGKMEMELGGIKYLVDSGIQSKMRQEIAVVDKDCHDIYMLGEVSQKIVVTPDVGYLLKNKS